MTTNSGTCMRRLVLVTVGQPAKEVDDVLSPIGVQVHLNSMVGGGPGRDPSAAGGNRRFTG